MDISSLSVKKIKQLIDSKSISSVELAGLYLDRIEQLNPQLNAFVTVDRDKTLVQAKQVDQLIAQGQRNPLMGVPIAHKDIFCAKGWLTTCGSKMLANFVAPYDAHIIEEFNKSGAITLGKTNMDEFAMGSSNETSYFGLVKNPWNLTKVPGGSSGGSAAAVAARLAPIATATDTGGSIRQPAALCGITGLKPTYGYVSRYGMIAYASSLDQGGLMAPSAEDIAYGLNIMAGHDERDSTSVNREKEDFSLQLNQSIEGLRIGVPQEFFSEGLDSDVAQAVELAIQELEKLGAVRVPLSLPNTSLSVPVYYVLAPAEASSNLSRFDGVRYGHRTKEYRDLIELYEKTRAEGFGAEVKRRILTGTYVLSRGYYDAYYLQAQRVRRLILQDYLRAFEQCDVILGPSTPTVAFGFNEKTSDPVSMYLSDIFTISVNLAGLPGLSIPVGFGKEHLPVGLQLIGPHFSEANLLNAAHQYQLHTDWHQHLPAGIAGN
ncbi:Asp-tRNA(Asn)/Glu-tRNA(Gln) amidotransferase subunit GatA [Ferrovum sp. PN-J185]|uniref:Asp-tRNA(Asn)/Glu-tRNA(Gln) amidotransferase subunit GatA n=1 Tax=Ferrovum sp. PN-J185 TaxID=1356306 RepID=UPI000796486A|nr:Asp-tRNA(Asn)/Glu-tRNA(Gln) amidotransferase subunit GatA [Ferrovum sp. PN-J185]KXW55610.1 glutamyl-tRNA(Gln) amidotransferase subunit A [Ferrovum sp. PN-J185]MCC6068887.1 Asp-tRNA(Asn)/Glu-tRNA(Gln) amidotransferase subunit GatA [Ferrovum sp. PN-J185]